MGNKKKSLEIHPACRVWRLQINCAVSSSHLKNCSLRNTSLFLSLLDQEPYVDSSCRAVFALRCSNSCSYIAWEEQPSQKAWSSALQSAFNYVFPCYFVRWVGRIAEGNHCSAMSPIKITVSVWKSWRVHASVLYVTHIERFIKTITLPSTARGGLLARLPSKAPTYLSLSVSARSSQELRSAPPEQKNAEGQCLVGGKSRRVLWGGWELIYG